MQYTAFHTFSNNINIGKEVWNLVLQQYDIVAFEGLENCLLISFIFTAFHIRLLYLFHGCVYTKIHTDISPFTMVIFQLVKVENIAYSPKAVRFSHLHVFSISVLESVM